MSVKLLNPVRSPRQRRGSRLWRLTSNGVKTKRIYKGRLITLTLDTICTKGRRLYRETVHHPGSCAIIPLLGDGRIVMVKQFRYPAKKELLEIPAGSIERGETPRQCAMRELKEEVGFKPKNLKKILDFFICPGYSTERMHLFIARGLERVSGSPEPDEVLRIKMVSISDAERLIESGKIQDAKTIIGIMSLKRGFI